jgi:cell division protease FtsH
MQVDEDEHNLMTKEEIENKIATLTGGRIAEDLIFHSITTGASNDIEQATKLARAMVTRFGMTDEFGMVALETLSNQYLGGDASLACSPDTSTAIDQKVIEVVRTQYERAESLLRSHMKELNALANYLYDHETITGEEFMDLLGRMEEEKAAAEPASEPISEPVAEPEDTAAEPATAEPAEATAESVESDQ